MAQFRSWAATDVGLKREQNEDVYVALDKVGLYAVADGVGGAAAGEVASGMVGVALRSAGDQLRSLVDHYDRTPRTGADRRAVFDQLKETFDSVNADIYKQSQDNERVRGMASTVSALVLSSEAAFMAHVGDSRIYLLRGEKLQRLTDDHTWLQGLIRSGAVTPEQASEFTHPNVLSRAIGNQPAVTTDLLYIDTQAGDIFLICSDGLTDCATDDDIHQVLMAKDLSGAPARLIDLAKQGGGKDNITVVVVQISPAVPTERMLEPLPHPSKVAFMRELFLFRELTEEEMLLVLRYVHEVWAQPGEPVVCQGESSDELYFVVEGHVDVLVDNVLVGIIGPGGHFGELAVLSQQERSATVTPHGGPVRLLRMEQEDFYHLSRTDQTIAIKILWAFLYIMGERVRNMSRLVASQPELIDAESQ